MTSRTWRCLTSPPSTRRSTPLVPSTEAVVTSTSVWSATPCWRCIRHRHMHMHVHVHVPILHVHTCLRTLRIQLHTLCVCTLILRMFRICCYSGGDHNFFCFLFWQPFWPTGTGCGRGFLSSMDTAWLIRGVGQRRPILELLTEREAIFQRLPQTTPENMNQNIKAYTIDPQVAERERGREGGEGELCSSFQSGVMSAQRNNYNALL